MMCVRGMCYSVCAIYAPPYFPRHTRTQHTHTHSTHSARKQFSLLVHEEGLRDAAIIVLSNIKNQGDETLVSMDELKIKLGVNEVDPTLVPIKMFEVNAYDSTSFQPVLEYVCSKYT